MTSSLLLHRGYLHSLVDHLHMSNHGQGALSQSRAALQYMSQTRAAYNTRKLRSSENLTSLKQKEQSDVRSEGHRYTEVC